MFRPTLLKQQTSLVVKRAISATSPGLLIFRHISILSLSQQSCLNPVRPVRPTSASTSLTSQRYYSPLCVDKPAKTYEFADVKKLSDAGDHPGIILVDVREPSEYKEGHIPTAINIPYNSSPGALGLESEDFIEAFGFDKPPIDQHLVFYCLGGVRSSAAEGIAATYGYQR